MSVSVEFKNVTKKYRMYPKHFAKVLDLFLPMTCGKDFYALQNISFEVEQGNIVGIIGVNGAGKSTLSNLISGVVPPSEGTVKINGEVALISIGSGLNNHLTGRENIELKCLMLGFKKQEIQNLIPKIIDFADIGDFIDQPIKSYSSGMKSRLGFAISVSIDPDILVIDEALSVGDKTFTQKSLDEMNAFKEKGKTIFFISHSIGQVKDFCQKALWLEAGEIKQYGAVEEVTAQYEQFIKEFKNMSKEEKRQFNQLIMDKRCNRSDLVESDLSEPRKDLRKNPKRKRALSISLYFLLFISLYACIFLEWSTLSSLLKVDKKVQAEKVELSKPTNELTKKQSHVTSIQKQADKETTDTKDIRYVQVPTGFVRSDPDLSTSQKVKMLSFGDAISIKGIQKDPIEKDLVWLKITSSDGKEGWISDKLVTKFSKVIDEDRFITKASQIIQINQLAKAITYLHKQNQEMRLSGKLNLDIMSQSSSQLINQFGEPTLREGQHSYMYHGKHNDFIFYTTNSTLFDKIVIKSIPN